MVFFFQAEDGIRDIGVTGVQTCALPIWVSAEQTSGFGAFSLTYLTVEIEGHDSLAAEGQMPIPGRFFAYYWNSSPRVLSYAREAAGVPAMYGVRRGEVLDGRSEEHTSELQSR